jgi:hypothetical protein
MAQHVRRPLYGFGGGNGIAAPVMTQAEKDDVTAKLKAVPVASAKVDETTGRRSLNFCEQEALPRVEPLQWVQQQLDNGLIVAAATPFEKSQDYADLMEFFDCTSIGPIYPPLVATRPDDQELIDELLYEGDGKIYAQPGDKVGGTDWSKAALYGGIGVAVLGLVWFATRK